MSTFCIIYRLVPIVHYLIENGANIEAKDQYNQWTPVHIACQYGHLPVVQYLIEKGTNIEAKTAYQSTPLHYACRSDSLLLVHCW